MSSGIYCYQNILNGKMYIGQAQDLSKRKFRHESNFRCGLWENTSPRENHPLWLAIKKYGRFNFIYFVIEYCDVVRLDELEIFYIESMKSHFTKGGYNLSLGGSTSRGTIHSESTRLNMSLAHIGHKQSPDLVEKRRVAVTGNKRKDSTSKYFGVYKISQAHRVYWTVDFRYKGEKYRQGCYQHEICAAIHHDLLVIKNKLDRPLNFSDTKLQKIMNSIEWIEERHKFLNLIGA